MNEIKTNCVGMYIVYEHQIRNFNANRNHNGIVTVGFLRMAFL
jgi:hypothetical protein